MPETQHHDSDHPIVAPFNVDPKVSPEVTAMLIPKLEDCENVVKTSTTSPRHEDFDAYYTDLVKREVASERREDRSAFHTSTHVTFDFDFGDVYAHRMESTGTTTFCGKDPFDSTNPGTAHPDFASTDRRRMCHVCKDRMRRRREESRAEEGDTRGRTKLSERFLRSE